MFADGGDVDLPSVCLTNGLFIVEVDLEDPARFYEAVGLSVNRNRRMKQNPVFHGINAGGGASNNCECY